MTAVEASVTVAAKEATAAHTAAVETREAVADLVSILNATGKVATFAAKHYPRMIAFATGIAAAAGYGNPKVIAFLQHFFGG